MRTTLDLDPEVLSAAREVSKLNGQSLGKVISDLARRGLEPQEKLSVRLENGIPILQHKRRPVPVTSELIRALAEQE